MANKNDELRVQWLGCMRMRDPEEFSKAADRFMNTPVKLCPLGHCATAFAHVRSCVSFRFA